jgi:hypothetical protein
MQCWDLMATTSGDWAVAGVAAMLPTGSFFYKHPLRGFKHPSPSAIATTPALAYDLRQRAQRQWIEQSEYAHPWWVSWSDTLSWRHHITVARLVHRHLGRPLSRSPGNLSDRSMDFSPRHLTRQRSILIHRPS